MCRNDANKSPSSSGADETPCSGPAAAPDSNGIFLSAYVSKSLFSGCEKNIIFQPNPANPLYMQNSFPSMRILLENMQILHLMYGLKRINFSSFFLDAVPLILYDEISTQP